MVQFKIQIPFARFIFPPVVKSGDLNEMSNSRLCFDVHHSSDRKLNIISVFLNLKLIKLLKSAFVTLRNGNIRAYSSQYAWQVATKTNCLQWDRVAVFSTQREHVRYVMCDTRTHILLVVSLLAFILALSLCLSPVYRSCHDYGAESVFTSHK